jgi:hypothetical protein
MDASALDGRTPARTAVQDGHPGLVCWMARADTKADGHRDRPHGRTRSSGCLQSSIRADWPGSTNDVRLSPPWAAVRPGVRWCPAVQGGSVHPTAMVRGMVKRLARPSPSRPCERPAWPHDAIRRFLALELDAEEGRPGRDPRSYPTKLPALPPRPAPPQRGPDGAAATAGPRPDRQPPGRAVRA